MNKYSSIYLTIINNLKGRMLKQIFKSSKFNQKELRKKKMIKSFQYLWPLKIGLVFLIILFSLSNDIRVRDHSIEKKRLK